MASRIIFHIGAPKSGSSAIQYFCVANRHKLSNIGIYYPEHSLDSNNVSGGHSELSGPIVNNNIESATDWLRSEYNIACKMKKTLLISAEGLYQYSIALKNIISELRISTDLVEVVAYFRHPVESLISNYNQAVKRNFLSDSMTDWIGNVLSNNGVRYHSGDIFFDWLTLFPVVKVRPFSLEDFFHGRIELDFLEWLGVSEKDFKDFSINPEKVNGSYTLSSVEFKRYVNLYLDRSNQRLNNKIDLLLQKFSDECGVDDRVDSSTYFSKASLEVMRDIFQAGLSRLDSEFFSKAGKSFRFSFDKNSADTSQGGFPKYSIPHVFKYLVSQDSDMQIYLFKCISGKSSGMRYRDNFELVFSDFNDMEDVLINFADLCTEKDFKFNEFLVHFSMLLNRRGMHDAALAFSDFGLIKWPESKILANVRSTAERKKIIISNDCQTEEEQ